MLIGYFPSFSSDILNLSFEATTPLIFFYDKVLKKKLLFLTYFIYEISFLAYLFNEFNLYILSLLLLVTIIIIYEILYQKLGLEKSFISFIAFSLNTFIVISYILTFFLVLKGIPEPIYIENISVFARYRYLALSAFSLIILLLYLKFSYFYQSLTFPFLKHEVFIIINKKYASLLDPICDGFLDKIQVSNYYKNLYKFLHFFFFQFFRIISILFFIYFVFGAGDLRYLLYLSPLFFLIWIFSIFDYYFITFFDLSKNYIQSLLKITTQAPHLDIKNDAIQIDPNNLSFSFTENALLEGINNRIDIYSKIWLDHAKLDFFFSTYKEKFKYLNIFLLLLQIICWFYLTVKFFVLPSDSLHAIFRGTLVMLGPFRMTSPTYFQKTTPLLQSKVYRVRKAAQAQLEMEQKGAYKGGHYVIADLDIQSPEDSDQVALEGSLTKGPSTREHPSQYLAPELLNGDKTKAQRIVYPDTPWIKKAMLEPTPVAGSETFLNKYKVEFMKNCPIPENT